MYRKQYVEEVESKVDLAKCNECLTDLENLNGTLGHIISDNYKITPGAKTIHAALSHVFHELQKIRANLLKALQESSREEIS